MSAAAESLIDITATTLVNDLPTLQRLALSYATRATHAPFLVLFALDAKLGAIVLGAREPVLAQIKLAWWRERLASPLSERPRGQPLLAASACWAGHEGALIELIDGWEAMLGETPNTEALATARAGAMHTLALLVGEPVHAELAEQAAKVWTDAETGTLPSASKSVPHSQLPRSLRPLAVLAGLSERSIRRGQRGLIAHPADMLCAIRLGLLGR